MTKSGLTASYSYDANGLRTSKTVNGVTTEFYWLEGRLLGQKTGNNTIFYLYDENGEMLGFTYGGQSYYYVRNLQGDVIALLDESCSGFVAEYSYSVWGELLSVTGNATIGNLNPIRYRGYYYDTETGFYYLQSRYYDPEICRFINADAYVSTGQGILGNNMFAYCGNNPVNCYDPSGKFSTNYLGKLNISTFNPKPIFIGFEIAEDIRNFDVDNESEEKVLASNYFSCYKGVPVIRTPSSMRSGSFGIIFLSKDVADPYLSPEDVVRHEHGHTRQLKELGVINYLFTVGIPSVFDLGEKWGNGEYYNKPWEVMANIYGNVEEYENSQTDINAAYKYHRGSQKIGPFILIFIE